MTESPNFGNYLAADGGSLHVTWAKPADFKQRSQRRPNHNHMNQSPVNSWQAFNPRTNAGGGDSRHNNSWPPHFQMGGAATQGMFHMRIQWSVVTSIHIRSWRHVSAISSHLLESTSVPPVKQSCHSWIPTDPMSPDPLFRCGGTFLSWNKPYPAPVVKSIISSFLKWWTFRKPLDDHQVSVYGMIIFCH